MGWCIIVHNINRVSASRPFPFSFSPLLTHLPLAKVVMLESSHFFKFTPDTRSEDSDVYDAEYQKLRVSVCDSRSLLILRVMSQ